LLLGLYALGSLVLNLLLRSLQQHLLLLPLMQQLLLLLLLLSLLLLLLQPQVLLLSQILWLQHLRDAAWLLSCQTALLCLKLLHPLGQYVDVLLLHAKSAGQIRSNLVARAGA